MKILFVCKYNRFRSRTAEAYFKKINENKNIKASSAGIFEGSYPLSTNQVKAGKELGININGKPRTISTKLLRKQDLIIITADDVPKSLFSRKNYKLLVWKIKDIRKDCSIKANKKIMKKIFKKVDKLNKQLEKEK